MKIHFFAGTGLAMTLLAACTPQKPSETPPESAKTAVKDEPAGYPSFNRPVHFEFTTRDSAKSRPFYEKVFGWKFMVFSEEQGAKYWYVVTGDQSEKQAVDGGMMTAGALKDNQGVYHTIHVESIEKTVAAVKENGGTEVMAKYPIPTVGYGAYVKDPEGTTWGLVQFDSTVKAPPSAKP